MRDLISREYLLNTFSKNSIFQKVTNAEGKNVIEIIQDAPVAFDIDGLIKYIEEKTEQCFNNCDFEAKSLLEDIVDNINEQNQ